MDFFGRSMIVMVFPILKYYESRVIDEVLDFFHNKFDWLICPKWDKMALRAQKKAHSDLALEQMQDENCNLSCQTR